MTERFTGFKAMSGAAALTLLLAVTAAAPAKAQFAGANEDMMTQFAPMLEMMKAKMGKKRFAALMRTAGPMMSKMMENGELEAMFDEAGLGGGGIRGLMGGSEMMTMMPMMMDMIGSEGGGQKARRGKRGRP